MMMMMAAILSHIVSLFNPARTSGEEVVGSIPAMATRSLLVGLVSIQYDRLRQKSWSPRSISGMPAHKVVRCLS